MLMQMNPFIYFFKLFKPEHRGSKCKTIIRKLVKGGKSQLINGEENHVYPKLFLAFTTKRINYYICYGLFGLDKDS